MSIAKLHAKTAAAACRSKNRVSLPATRTTLVSVVMPIRNEQAYIRDTIMQVLEQDTAWTEVDDDIITHRKVAFDIIVVDGCSTDRTPEIVADLARRDSRVRLLNNPKKLSSSARNIGVESSEHEYVVIVDGHCEIPSRTYLIDLVQAFERTGADCLGRPQPLDVTNATSLQVAIAAARNTPLGHHPDSFVYSKVELPVPAISVAVAYRRSVFKRIGLFDPGFDACEDCEFNHRVDRAGMTCYLIPALAVRYQPRNSLTRLFGQLSRYGRGRIRLFRKHNEAISIAAVIPGLFVLGVLVGPIASLLVPPLWWVFLSVMAVYGLAVLIFSLSVIRQPEQRRSVFWMPLVFLAIHLGAGWGVLCESIESAFAAFSPFRYVTPHDQ